MGVFITSVIRIVLIVAMWIAWGPLAGLVALGIFLLEYGILFVSTHLVWLGLVGIAGLVTVIAGFFAVGAAWGAGWVVGLLVIYVIGAVELSKSFR